MNRKKIEDILDKLEIIIGNLGYKYWIDAIEIYYNNEKNNGEIYKEIAKRYNVTSRSVERALRHAYENKKEKIKRILNINYNISTKILLAAIVRELKR